MEICSGKPVSSTILLKGTTTEAKERTIETDPFVGSYPSHNILYINILSKMVCPYRLVTTFFAAVASMFYIRSTFAEDVIDAGNGKSGEGTAAKKKGMSSEKRALIVSLLIVLHVDLLVTGYLRAGVKEGFAMLAS
jgi:hypothetical protein